MKAQAHDSSPAAACACVTPPCMPRCAPQCTPQCAPQCTPQCTPRARRASGAARTLLLLAGLLALPVDTAAQLAQPLQDAAAAAAAAPQEPPLSMGVVATINGHALTGADISYFARGLADMAGSVAPGFHLRMRRMLAERLLLADEAERLGLKLNEYEVDSYYERFFGFQPPYAEIDEVGLSVERQKELVKTMIFAELYVLHRVGIATDHMSLIPADPQLTRLLDVTPRQLKEYYLEHPEQFVQPASVAFTVWPCDEMAQALRVLGSLEAGRTPDGAPGLNSRVAEDDVAQDLGFMPDAVRLLSEGQAGDLGGPFSVRTEAGSQAVIMRLDERLPEERIGFTGEVQRSLRRQIQASQLERARLEALERLRRDARSVYWPQDLFDEAPAEDAVPADEPR